MYNSTLHCGKNVSCDCLQAFRTAEKLKCNIKIALKLMVNKGLNKNGEYVRFINCGRKIKLPFMIYEDFESNSWQMVIGSKTEMSPLGTNIKNVLLAGTTTN